MKVGNCVLIILMIAYTGWYMYNLYRDLRTKQCAFVCFIDVLRIVTLLCVFLTLLDSFFIGLWFVLLGLTEFTDTTRRKQAETSPSFNWIPYGRYYAACVGYVFIGVCMMCGIF